MQEEALNPGPTTTADRPPTGLSADDARRLQRIQRLIWATWAGVALTLPAVLIVPLSPWIAPVSAILLVITDIGLFVLSSWVRQTLLFRNQKGEIPRQGEPGYGKVARSYVSYAANIAALFYLMGGQFIVLQWWQTTKDWDSLLYGLGQLVSALIVYILFVIVWGRAGSKIDRFLNRGFGIALILGIAALGFAANFWVVPGQISKLKVRAPAPWAEQWADVQQAIAGKYPDLVLDNIIASPEYDTFGVCGGSLNTTFYLKGATGTSLDIVLRDSNPEATLQIRDAQIYSPMYSEADLAKLKAASATVQIGPRDAFLKAKAALEKDIPGVDACGYRSMTLYLQDAQRGTGGAFNSLNRPSVWDIFFSTKTGQVNYWVDAQTGDILLREKK